MWLKIIKLYWRVTVFKENPANTPHSLILTLILALLYIFLLSIQWVTVEVEQPISFLKALFLAALLVVSYVVYTGGLLAFFKLRSRILKSLACLFAGHFIVHLVALPLVLLAPVLVSKGISSGLALVLATLYLIVSLILTVWQFMVAAYIYKHAFDTDYLTAMLASLGLIALNILTVSLGQ